MEIRIQIIKIQNYNKNYRAKFKIIGVINIYFVIFNKILSVNQLIN
jgi:hypothetical protein